MEVTLSAWLNAFPAPGGGVQTALLPELRFVDPLTGRPEPMAQPRRAFTELLADLRDSEQLPQQGPVQFSANDLRALDRKQIVVQRTDAEGNAHPVVLEGDTPGGWAIRDWLKREVS